MKWFKKPSIKIIEFIPLDEYAPLFPPKPAKMTLPNWYKNLDTHMEGTEWTAESLFQNEFPRTIFTIKRCLPVQDYIMNGYTIFTNTDVLLTNRKDEDEVQRFYWATPRQGTNLFGQHPHNQCPININGEKYDYVKIFCNWIVRTPPGYSCLVTQPFYNQEDRFTLFPAIVDTDTFDQTIGFIGYLNPKYKNVKLEAGTPIINVFPFKREEWKMKVFDKILPNKNTRLPTLKNQFFTNVYRKFYWSKKRFD